MILLFLFALLIPISAPKRLDGDIAPEICGEPNLIFEHIFSLYNHTNNSTYPITYLNYTETIRFTECTLNQTVFSAAKMPFVLFSMESDCQTISLTSDIIFTNSTSKMQLIYLQSSNPENPKTIDSNGFSFIMKGYARAVFSHLTFIHGHPAIRLHVSAGTTHICNVTFDGNREITNTSGIHLLCSSLFVYTCVFKHYLTNFNTDKLHNELEERTAPFDHYNDSISGGALTGIFWDSGNQAIVSIRDSLFSNNEVRNRTVMENNSKFVSWSTGGAIFFIFKNHTVDNIVEITNTEFIDNTAGAIGGGLFVTFHEYAANNTIRVNDTLFEGNKAFVHSGGMGVYHDGFSINNGVYLTRVKFRRNYSFRAGGGFNIEYNFDYPKVVLNFNVFVLHYPSFTTFPAPLFLTDCLFEFNNSTLDAAAFQAWAYVSYLIHPSAVVLENCIFENNHAKGYAAVLASGVTLIFMGVTRIKNNSNSGLYLTHAKTQFIGSIYFIGNVNSNPGSGGGGLLLYDGSYLYINLNTSLYFLYNNASKGPALYIDTGVLHHADYNVFFASDCSMQAVNYDVGTVKPTVGENIFFILEDNYAVHSNGSLRDPNYPIFLTNLDDCVPGRLDSLSVPNGTLPEDHWNEFITLGNMNFRKTSIYLLVETDPSQIETINKTKSSSEEIQGYPGQLIDIPPLKALDQLGTRTKATLFLQSNYKHCIQVYPDVIVVEKSVTNTKLKYKLLKPDFNDTVTLTFTAVTSSYQLEHTMQLKIIPCPAYLVLKYFEADNTYYCDLYSLSTNSLFLAYDSTQAKAYIQDGSWMSFTEKLNCNDSVLNAPCYEIFVQYCPSGFCECKQDENSIYPGCMINVNEKNISDQCHPNRKGIYCGICIPGKSVGIKSFECRECDTTKMVVGTFVAAIDMLILILFCMGVLWWNISYPPELAGVIFYIQTVALVYNANANGWVIFQFFWLPLKYYSESPFLKTILDPCTVFPDFKVIYSIIYQLNGLIIMILILSIFYILTRHMKTFYNHHFLDGFVFLLIFIYVTFAQVSFYFFNLEFAPDGSPVFGLQTDISYYYVAPFGGIFGLLVLLIPILFIISAYGYFARLQLLTDVLRAPYKPHLWYWTGVDLLRRLLIVIVIIATTAQRPYRKIAICIAVLVILLAHVIAQPYKKRWVNIVEALLLYNLFVLSAINLDMNLATAHVYYIDLLLLFLPYIYALSYIGFRSYNKVKHRIPASLKKRVNIRKTKKKGETLDQPLLINETLVDTIEMKSKEQMKD